MTGPQDSINEIERHLREIASHGFTIIEGVIDRGEAASVSNSIRETVENISGYSDNGVGFLATVLNHDRSIVPHLADGRLMEILERVLGRFVHVSFASAIINAPGNPRGGWHADWPFNQEVAGHIPTPYSDTVMHLTTLWMLSPFNADTGGTLVAPGSHRESSNPTGSNGVNKHDPIPSEINATGEAGDVLLFDSRLWHATAPNTTSAPRVAAAIRFAPWWLDVSVLRPGSRKRAQMVDETGAVENEAPPLQRDVYANLPDELKSLFRHMVE